MQKRLNITIDADVYQGLLASVGRRNISRFLTELARTHALPSAMRDAYQEMARDEQRESEALEWSEGLILDIMDERR